MVLSATMVVANDRKALPGRRRQSRASMWVLRLTGTTAKGPWVEGN